jgi:hypothetical protein
MLIVLKFYVRSNSEKISSKTPLWDNDNNNNKQKFERHCYRRIFIDKENIPYK